VTNPFALDTPATAPAPATAPVAPVAAPAPVQQTPAPAAPVAADPFGGGDPFSDPAPQEPKGPRMRDMYGRLLLVIPFKLEEGIPNRLGKPGDTQDRLTADVIVLDGGTIHYGGAPEKVPAVPHNKSAEVPLKRSRMFISNAGIISQCRQALAKKLTTGTPGMVLGRLAVGEAKGDNNPPYLLQPATDADKQVARAYLATVDPFA
jgi:hypothetical protein